MPFRTATVSVGTGAASLSAVFAFSPSEALQLHNRALASSTLKPVTLSLLKLVTLSLSKGIEISKDFIRIILSRYIMFTFFVFGVQRYRFGRCLSLHPGKYQRQHQQCCKGRCQQAADNGPCQR